jgi:hypothetical protein
VKLDVVRRRATTYGNREKGERGSELQPGAWSRAAGSATPLSPSYGVVSSTTARRLGASDGAARIDAEAASDTTVRTGDFYTGKQLPDATAQLGQSGHGAARHRQWLVGPMRQQEFNFK